jgi:hypothetical protein
MNLCTAQAPYAVRQTYMPKMTNYYIQLELDFEIEKTRTRAYHAYD